jgi:uncharacterized protein YdhG (YjbR/CyaY superfamily)
MTTSKKQYTTIDQYIARFPRDVQAILEKIREIVHKATPEAEEVISYAIPAFRLRKRNLIYFAGWKEHVSLYPIPSGSAAFREEIAPYVAGRGTLKFPLNKPIPYPLIKKVVELSVAQHIA